MADTPGFESAVLSKVLAQIDGMVEATASAMGMPPDGKQYSQREIDDEWNFSPIADPQQRATTMIGLKQSGKTDEEITDTVYPNRRRLVTTGRPKLSDQIAFAQQQSKRMAKMLAEQQQQSMPSSLDAFSAPLPDPGPLPPPPMGMMGMGPQAQPVQAVGASMPPAPMMAPSPVPPPAPPPAGSMLDQPISMMGG
jgi:hypothetical protein